MEQAKENLLQAVAGCHPLRVILHGEKRSVSSGKLKSASLAIVVPDGSDKDKMLRELYLSVPLDFPVNINLYTAAEWAELTADPCSYASWIAKKGTVLYGEP